MQDVIPVDESAVIISGFMGLCTLAIFVFSKRPRIDQVTIV